MPLSMWGCACLCLVKLNVSRMHRAAVSCLEGALGNSATVDNP